MIQGLECEVITECLFEPVNLQTERTIANGQSVSLTIGHPYWTASMRVETPTRQAKHVWRTWATSRQGARFPFLATRKFSAIPRGGSLTDSGLSISAIHVANSTITLAGAGTYTAKIGDMISYYTAAGGYYLGEITAGGTAVAGAVTLSVWPYPKEPHATTARPRRMYPLGEFYLTGRLARTETHDPDYMEFEARQIIRVGGDDVSPISPPMQDANLPIVEALTL